MHVWYTTCMIETQTNAKDGFIGKQHAAEITETFGADLAAKMQDADEQTPFLTLLFEDFAK